MHPVLFRIFGFEISSFGVMMALAFLLGLWLTARRMQEEGLDPQLASNMLLWVMIGGVGGSKLYFAVDTALREDLNFWSLLLAREGITWYGGLIGAVALGAVGCRANGIPVKTFTNAVAVATALGQAVGRVGCFLVGDDYGRTTDLPWGVAFPEGAPPTLRKVHPTQLYEVAWLVPVAALLWRRRRKSPFLFGEYLMLNGAGRFVIEHWRVNPPVALGLTEPQWIGLALVMLGGSGWLYHRGRSSLQPG